MEVKPTIILGFMVKIDKKDFVYVTGYTSDNFLESVVSMIHHSMAVRVMHLFANCHWQERH